MDFPGKIEGESNILIVEVTFVNVHFHKSSARISRLHFYEESKEDNLKRIAMLSSLCLVRMCKQLHCVLLLLTHLLGKSVKESGLYWKKLLVSPSMQPFRLKRNGEM